MAAPSRTPREVPLDVRGRRRSRCRHEPTEEGPLETAGASDRRPGQAAPDQTPEPIAAPWRRTGGRDPEPRRRAHYRRRPGQARTGMEVAGQHRGAVRPDLRHTLAPSPAAAGRGAEPAAHPIDRGKRVLRVPPTARMQSRAAACGRRDRRAVAPNKRDRLLPWSTGRSSRRRPARPAATRNRRSNSRRRPPSSAGSRRTGPPRGGPTLQERRRVGTRSGGMGRHRGVR